VVADAILAFVHSARISVVAIYCRIKALPGNARVIRTQVTVVAINRVAGNAALQLDVNGV
jgi:hypothetical protein